MHTCNLFESLEIYVEIFCKQLNAKLALGKNEDFSSP